MISPSQHPFQVLLISIIILGRKRLKYTEPQIHVIRMKSSSTVVHIVKPNHFQLTLLNLVLGKINFQKTCLDLDLMISRSL